MSLGQDVIAIAVQTGLAAFVTGPPGTGKTLWTRALGKALGRHVVTHICALHPPEDYAGIPGDVQAAIGKRRDDLVTTARLLGRVLAQDEGAG